MDYCMSSAWDGPITQSECCVNVKYCYLNSLRAFKIFVYIYIYIFIYLFIYGYAGSSLMCRLPLVLMSRGYSLVVVCGLLTVVAFLVVEHGP